MAKGIGRLARDRAWRTACAGLATAGALAGCSSLGGGGSTPEATATAAPASPPATADTSVTGKMKSLFSGPSYNLVAGTPPPSRPLSPSSGGVNCPSVDYRQGAATLAINGSNADNSALSLRYEGSLLQTARECAVRGGDLTIKVGIEGRIVVGPAGGPGPITVPLRYALVREGYEPKTIWTKLYLVPVTVPDGQLNVPFVHVEEDMTVPVPPSTELDAYMIYVGFDPEGAVPAKPKPAPKGKPSRTRAAQ